MATRPPPTPRPLKARKILTIKDIIRNEDCYLLRLPRELRDIIYQYVLIESSLWDKRHSDDCPFRDLDAPTVTPPFANLRSGDGSRRWCVSPEDQESCNRTCIRRKGLGLLRVCGQLYDEANEVLWGQNMFCFTGALVVGLSELPVMMKKKVRRISLMRENAACGDHVVRSVFDAFAGLESLTHLELPAEYMDQIARLTPRMRHLQQLRFVSFGKFWLNNGGEWCTLYARLSYNIERPRCQDVTCSGYAGSSISVLPDGVESVDGQGIGQDWQSDSLRLREHASTRREMLDMESASYWLDAVSSVLEGKVLAHQGDLSHMQQVRLADGKNHTVRIWGLPLLPPVARRKRRVRMVREEARCMSKLTATQLPLRAAAPMEENLIAPVATGKIARLHRGGNRNAEKLSETEEEDREAARALRIRQEAMSRKSEKKTDDRARAKGHARSEKEILSQRKAALQW